MCTTVFSDLTPLIITVSSQSIIEDMTKESLDELEKCATLKKVKTPNKVTISCDYPLEGRYVALIKDSETPDSFSINELQPILLGKVLYFSSTCPYFRHL